MVTFVAINEHQLFQLLKANFIETGKNHIFDIQ